MEGERFNLACFLSQQAAEKALKAFLIANKKEPWGHSVAELCETASMKDSDFRNIKKHAATLDIYYIPTRYPNGLPGGIHIKKKMLIGHSRYAMKLLIWLKRKSER